MTRAASSILGRPLWYELMTTDTKGAEAFYSAVIGWTAAPSPNSPQPYTVFSRDGSVEVAGLMALPADLRMPPFWSMYVGVPKLEDGVAHITRLGGRTCSPVIEVPMIGRMQMMMDPQGASFYIYEPAGEEPRPEGPAEIGEASWHELMTTDAPAAMAFYGEVFGWTQSDALDMGPMGKYYLFNRPHGMIGGMMNKGPEMSELPPFWQVYFRVPDITSAVDRITKHGGTIVNGPMEVPGGDRIVNARDPQGAMFNLHARAK
ncbi:MAG TPA: VOC family protein [Vicinamibacterales bacterium]